MNLRELVFLIIILIVFLLTIAISIFAFKGKETWRKIFKCAPLTLLSILMIYISPNSPFVYVALIFSLIGDAIIINTTVKYFIVGAASFFVAHLFNFLAFFDLNNITDIPHGVYAIIPVVIIAMIVLSLVFLKGKVPFMIQISGGFYFSCLIINIIFGFFFAFYTNNMSNLLIGFGYIFFLVSDIFIGTQKFIKEIKYHEFYIMSSYFMSQIFIVLGWGLLLFL